VVGDAPTTFRISPWPQTQCDGFSFGRCATGRGGGE